GDLSRSVCGRAVRVVIGENASGSIRRGHCVRCGKDLLLAHHAGSDLREVPTRRRLAVSHHAWRGQPCCGLYSAPDGRMVRRAWGCHRVSFCGCAANSPDRNIRSPVPVLQIDGWLPRDPVKGCCRTVIGGSESNREPYSGRERYTSAKEALSDAQVRSARCSLPRPSLRGFQPAAASAETHSEQEPDRFRF